MSGMSGMSRTGRGRGRARAEIAVARVLEKRLGALPGIRAFPSDANFILFRVAHADGVFAALKARGILIKNVNGSHPMLADCLRVTVGTPQENDRFVEALSVSLPRAA